MVNPTTTTEDIKLADVTVSVDNFSLSRADRCDVCGVAALYRVVFDGGNELTFCSHHYNDNKAKLLTTAATIYDESAQLG